MTQHKSDIRSVSLRILRDGPTHNHLLSPLTAYLAAVGPYEAVSVRMPYEHRRLLRDLNALRYGATMTRGPDPTRITPPDRRIIADDVAEIFAAVPGLTAEMATEASCDGFLTHLCLVFSAAELSLLPFEMATAPRGFPGEGTPISIQSVAPVVMTRAIPGASGKWCNWDRKPNVLFIAAQPSDLPEVPVRAHLLALIRALQSWVGSTPESRGDSAGAPDGAASETVLQKHLTILPNATLAQIEQHCRSTAFTHVHILAHSQTFEEGSQTQFALALHGESGGTELVSSERLQAALRLPMRRQPADDEFSHPLVVSLATCDSGNQAQVVFPTMSLAHALHAAGVPLVVGSLFPLSYRGSVVMTETLYTGLLRGRDPRRVLYDVRHDVFRADQHTHDWASLVAYASLPDDKDLQAQIQSFAFSASNAGIKATVLSGQGLVDALRVSDTAKERDELIALVFKNDTTIDTAAKDLPLGGVYVLEGRGSLASSLKQRAEILWNAAKVVGVQTAPGKKLLAASKERLAQSRESYVKASRAPRWMHARPDAQLPTMHWVMTQALSLALVLDQPLDFRDWWVAMQDADNYLDPAAERGADTRGRDQEDMIWAHASKAELALLAYAALQGGRVTSELGPGRTADDWKGAAELHARSHRDLSRAMGRLKLVEDTGKNLARYTNWWFDDDFVGTVQTDATVGGKVRMLVTELLAILAAR